MVRPQALLAVCTHYVALVVNMLHAALMGLCLSCIHAQRLQRLTYINTSCYVPRVTRAKCVRVYDGDTVHLAYYMRGHGPVRSSCRLAGIDTAELRGTTGPAKVMALAAMAWVQSAIEDKLVYVTVLGFDKYGRLLADLRVRRHDPTISQRLLSLHLAVAYDGKRKADTNWQEMAAKAGVNVS